MAGGALAERSSADKYRTLNIHTQGDYMVISLAFCALFQHHQFAIGKKMGALALQL